MFGEHATVVLPPTEKGRVASIWALVDDGAGFDEVLDALISDGLRELPGFVLVSDSDGETKVVIRGAARAEFTTDEDTVTVEGSSATTWAERSLTGVHSMRIDVAESDGADDLPIPGGLVRIARTDRPAYAAHRGERSADLVEPAEPAEPAPEPEPAAPVGTALDETVFFPPPQPVPPVVQEPVQEPREEPDDEIGQETPLDGPPTNPQEPSLTEEAGWSQPVPATASAEHDGHTQAGNWNPGEFARSQPGIPGQPPAPSVLAAPVAKLTFSSGEVVDVDRAVIVGRAPEARRFTSTEQPRLVTVPSPNQEISSTHLEIRPGAGADHGSAVVTDLGLDQRDGAGPARPRARGPPAGHRRPADPRRHHRPRRRRDDPGRQRLTCRAMSDQQYPDRPAASFPVAGLDRRFYAFVIDRLIGWGAIAGACWAAYHFFLRDDRLVARPRRHRCGGAGGVAALRDRPGRQRRDAGQGGGRAAGRQLGHRHAVGVGRALLRGMVLGARHDPDVRHRPGDPGLDGRDGRPASAARLARPGGALRRRRRPAGARGARPRPTAGRGTS